MGDFAYLFDMGDDNDRERFTNQKKGQTEQAQFRVASMNVRRIEEICASKIDPRIKTKSDAYQDAVALWLEDFYNNHADGVTGRILSEWKMEQAELKNNERLRFLDRIDTSIETSLKMHDVEELNQILGYVKMEFNWSQKGAPPVYKRELIERINKLEELVKREYLQ